MREVGWANSDVANDCAAYVLGKSFVILVVLSTALVMLRSRHRKVMAPRKKIALTGARAPGDVGMG